MLEEGCSDSKEDQDDGYVPEPMFPATSPRVCLGFAAPSHEKSTVTDSNTDVQKPHLSPGPLRP